MEISARVNIELAKATNYLILGNWSDQMSYKLSDAGVPVVRVPDGTSLGYSVYALNVAESTVGASPAGAGSSEWRLVESAEFIYMQQAYIERLQFESARGGGFEVENGRFISIKKDAGGKPFITIDGTTGKIQGGDVDVTGEIKGTSGFFEGLVRMPFKNYVDSVDWWLGPGGDRPIVTENTSANIRMYPMNLISTVVNLPTTGINGYRITILNECTDAETSLNNWGRISINAGTNRIINSNYPSSPTTSSVVQSISLERGEIIELLGVEMGSRAPMYRDKGWLIMDRKRVLPITS